MRQWLLTKLGWRPTYSRIIRIFGENNKTIKYKTEILYRKGDRFTVIKIPGAWDLSIEENQS